MKKCFLTGCNNKIRSRDLCATHYNQLRRKNLLEPKEVTTCSVEGCDRLGESKGMCMMHYNRYRRNGSVERKVRANATECRVAGCPDKPRAMDLCPKHYHRDYRGKLDEQTILLGDSTLEHALEDLEELLDFGERNIENLWKRAGFKSEQHMMYHATEELKERIATQCQS